MSITTHQEFTFKVANIELYGQLWKPKDIKAILLVVHGMGEHSGRYRTHFAQKFLKANIAIISFDQFGHGKTQGKKGHTPGYSYNLDTIDQCKKIARKEIGNFPLFIYGHSMGGNLVANYILKKDNDYIASIISSPMLRLAFTPPAWKLKVGALLQNIYPAFTEKTGLNANHISRNNEAVKKYINDPLIHDKISINYSLPFFKAGEWAITNAKQLNKPTFIVHGTGDNITDHKASIQFAKNAGDKAKIKLYKDAFHELHNDLCSKEELTDILQFIQSFL